uniref:Outer membrane protein beta-barrel domain-containing protein n=1 Tax=Desulfobacca acetoxidans TaxID=60893 RepID=A0A7C3Z9P7_9BACT
MKKWKMVWVIAALALLPALSATAQAAMYMEGYVGGNGASNLGSTATVIGGWRLGVWFVPEGVLGLKYPNWLKHFGFYTDISVHGISSDRRELQGDGYIATFAFMPAVRWGFVKDEEVPFGRFQPYLAVGPAIFHADFNNFSGAKVSAALVMDAGIRGMLSRKFSVDVFFRYRYAQQNVTYNLFSGCVGFSYHF